VDIREVEYDPGFFDEEENRVEPADNPFVTKVLPMSPV
jgi:putative transposase